MCSELEEVLHVWKQIFYHHSYRSWHSCLYSKRPRGCCSAVDFKLKQVRLCKAGEGRGLRVSRVTWDTMSLSLSHVMLERETARVLDLHTTRTCGGIAGRCNAIATLLLPAESHVTCPCAAAVASIIATRKQHRCTWTCTVCFCIVSPSKSNSAS